MAQNKEFESFNGPILMTTNCVIPLRKDNTYLDRLITTGMTGYPGDKHIADRPQGGSKDFSEISTWPKNASRLKKLRPEKLSAVLPTTKSWPWPIKWWMP